ncbi:hypothetical protein LXH09_27625, partial [Streptomyces sp. CS7]|uniref:hypothetical protein n=1 Tax=Streptomyces sp. CS-7 TaxID=2906769 RepID=UPI0021B18071
MVTWVQPSVTLWDFYCAILVDQGELAQAHTALGSFSSQPPRLDFPEGKRLSPETDPHAFSPHAPTTPRFPPGRAHP